MKTRFTRAPTFTKAITAAAVFTIAYLASASSLPPCTGTAAILSPGGECIERQSFLHTASGWLTLISLAAAVLLLALQHKDSIPGLHAPAQQARQEPPAQAPAPGRDTGYCANCGTRIITGDRFCQGCGIPAGSLQS